jgi:transcriptional regulator with XRE-family HTH domain
MRQEKGLSLTQMAAATDGKLHRQTIWLWESGKSVPGSAHLAVLADTLGVTMDSFFADDDYHGNKEPTAENQCGPHSCSPR